MRRAGVAVLALVVAAGATHGSALDRAAALPLTGADILLLGEIHDNPVHHDVQANVVKRVAPAALVFEMLSPEQAATANRVGTERGVEALAEALSWEGSGWPDFNYYFPILTAAPTARVYGAALPPEQVRRAFESGAEEVFGADANRFGLTLALPDAEQAEREDMQFDAHCQAMPANMMGGMVEAQRLRDAHFSAVTLDALTETDGPVAVITGNGHARVDWGMPVYLRAAAPEVRVISLGLLEAEPEEAPPFDHWIVTAPAEREDPCLAFQ